MANNRLTPSTSTSSAHQLQSQQQNHIHTSTSRRDSDKEPEEKQPERNVTRTTGNGAVTLQIEPDDQVCILHIFKNSCIFDLCIFQANSSLLTDETAPPADPAITQPSKKKTAIITGNNSLIYQPKCPEQSATDQQTNASSGILSEKCLFHPANFRPPQQPSDPVASNINCVQFFSPCLNGVS